MFFNPGPFKIVYYGAVLVHGPRLALDRPYVDRAVILDKCGAVAGKKADPFVF